MNAEQREILEASIQRVVDDLGKLHEYVCDATLTDFSSTVVDLRSQLALAKTNAKNAIPYLRNVE
jgi:hypothetical protein